MLWYGLQQAGALHVGNRLLPKPIVILYHEKPQDFHFHVFSFEQTVSPDEAYSTPGNTPVIRSSRKRRRLKDSLAALSQQNDEMESPRMPCKRRSSNMHDAITAMSMSASSLLDATPDETLTANGKYILTYYLLISS